MSCEHKNLKTVNNMLLCKDCGQQLPLSFLTDRGKKKGKDADPAPVVQPETPPVVIEAPTFDAKNIVIQSSSDEKPTENPPVESQTDKSTSEKKPRKNAKKGA